MSDTIPKSTSLIGKAKEFEVASVLIANGLYVFFPLVDAGFDLVVTNRRGSAFVPVQVRFRTTDPALGLLPKDRDNFDGTNVVIAWTIGIGKTAKTWFIPYDDWIKQAIAPPARKDRLAYVTISENAHWLSRYEGPEGIRRVFGKLFH